MTILLDRVIDGANTPFMLLSGGIDATGLAFEFFRTGKAFRGLLFSIGQASGAQQEGTVRRFSLRTNVPVEVADFNLAKFFSPFVRPPHIMLSEGELLKPQEETPSCVVVMVASYYAAMSGAEVLFYPATIEDLQAAPQLKDICELVTQLTKLASGAKNFEIVMPYVNKTRPEVLTMLDGYYPHEDTWSCNWGHADHCGKCGGCTVRKLRYKDAGINDPTTYLS